MGRLGGGARATLRFGGSILVLRLRSRFGLGQIAGGVSRFGKGFVVGGFRLLVLARGWAATGAAVCGGAGVRGAGATVFITFSCVPVSWGLSDGTLISVLAARVLSVL